MKRPTCSLLLLLFLHVVPHNFSELEPNPPPDECWKFLQNLAKFDTPAINRSIEENNTLLYSGHTINDLGNYPTCKKLATQKYNLFQMETVFLGFCGPSYCSIGQLQNYSDFVIQNISNITHKDLGPFNITVIDPTAYKIEKGFSLLISLILFAVISVLAVTGTISANFFKKKNDPKSNHAIELGEENLREALTTNKETINETFSRETANADIQKEKDTSIAEGKPDDKSTLRKIAECFDFKKNLQDLFNFRNDPSHDPNLNVFHAIRALAFGYIVLGHATMYSLSPKTSLSVQEFLQSTWFLIAAGAFYSVDIFFYLSGFFTGFLLISKLKKMPLGFSSYIKLIFHRLFRLWPAYMVALLLYWKIAVYYGDGVLWFGYVAQAQKCSTSFWQHVFFVYNITEVPDQNQCFPWGWYLSCDFQMFLISPLICWAYLKKKSSGETVIWILLGFSIISSYYESINTGFTYALAPRMQTDGTVDYFFGYYANTIVRLSPYLIGLLLGLKFREYKNGNQNLFHYIQTKKINGILMVLTGLAFLVFIILYPRGLQTGQEKWSNAFATSWSALTRPLFSLAIFLLTAPSLVGNLSKLTAFMSNVIFTLFSRLSFAGYLVHYIIMLIILCDTNQIGGFSEWHVVKLVFAITVLAILVGMFLHLFVEKPLTNLEMKFLNSRSSSRKDRVDK